MKLNEIIIDLQNLNKEIKSHDLWQYTEKLKSEYMQETYITKPSDKKRLSGIKRVLNNKKNKCRPLLSCFTPLNDGGVVITDSYQLYKLNDDKLPFKVAFMNNYKSHDEYLQGNPDLKEQYGCYPNIENLIPETENAQTTITTTTEYIEKLYKTTAKTNGIKIHTYKNDDIEFTINLEYLKNCIDILKLKGSFKILFYGMRKPLKIENESKEAAIILPIVKY